MTTHENNLDGILRKVQGLMAVADDPATTPEAAASYRAKAEALMLKYRLEETMLGTVTNGGVKPVWRTIRVCKLDNEFMRTYRFVLAHCLSHMDAKSGTKTVKDEATGEWWYETTTVGYESDLRYAELLFTSFSLAFAAKMEPKYNPDISDQENAYNMRSAGMEGRRIAMAIYGKDDKPLRVKVRNMFRAEAEARGESVEGLSGRGASVATFRESYADGFCSEVNMRLWRMRQSTGDEGVVVLKSRKEAVLDAWYEKFPHLRPGTMSSAPALGGRDTCEKCKKAKSGYCREHQWLKPSMARVTYRAHSQAGYSRGQTAAQSVDLGRKGTGRVGQAGPTSTTPRALDA